MTWNPFKPQKRWGAVEMSSEFVLDCSVSGYWFLEKGPAPDIAYARAVEQSLEDHQAIVPQLWQQEMTNILLTHERKEQISLAGIVSLLKKIEPLPIEIDFSFNNDILYLGIEFGLTAYDACYLSLALNRGLPLATLDRALIKAATAAGVQIYQGVLLEGTH